MEAKIDFINGGTVTSPQGFFAGATCAGIKKKATSNLDLGILFSQVPCVAAGLFTTMQIKSAPVVLSQQKLQKGRAVALIANSGCANAYTGEQGMIDATEMTALAARSLGISADDVLLASTGVTGQTLPMDLIRKSIPRIVLSRDCGHDLAKAIMTTDRVSKEVAVSVHAGESKFIIGGIAKGSGMIHPNLGTMFCFLTTDATLEPNYLRSALHKAMALSFNMISVDGDTSPSDTVLLMANGLMKNKPITSGSQLAPIFQQALNKVCIYLAKAIAADGEGATKLLEVTVGGAASIAQARIAARTIIGSSLVKTAVHGADPNWGRIIAALDRSGVELVETKIDLAIGDISVVKGGRPTAYEEASVVKVLKQTEVQIKINLNLGKASATAWGCDLSAEYVAINSQYMT